MTRITSYAYEADVHCVDCTKDRFGSVEGCAPYDENWIDKDQRDNTGNPVTPIFSTRDEADTPQHCCDCGVFLENALTDDGRAYVKEKLESGRGAPDILKQWKEFYGTTVE